VLPIAGIQFPSGEEYKNWYSFPTTFGGGFKKHFHPVMRNNGLTLSNGTNIVKAQALRPYGIGDNNGGVSISSAAICKHPF
jgi:hypothetical protein